ncbi:hypothetical protein QTO34_008197 [Cnephaeus nilssonii]|uniref:Pre-mRNA-splicing factor RBM22 n=1 Tax=Cnephaeus nilssonii TaxID=3371016 RepID=A0AA40LVU5_CNENI|nr:hypothetical protein QTO34_008197 [Eptesicus nilssonii]
MDTQLVSSVYVLKNNENKIFQYPSQSCLLHNKRIGIQRNKYEYICCREERSFNVGGTCPGCRLNPQKLDIVFTSHQEKNVCQTCLLDLEYGLPIQVRDAGLSFKDDMPKSDVNKEYFTQTMEREMSNSDGTRPVGMLGQATATRDRLLKLARTTPYYNRNPPHICSFWGKGECKRGEECPYRHEKPTDPDDPLADQNIKDRYCGIRDPVADKLLKRASTMPRLDPPEDKTLTTLYVGGVGDTITETDLRDHIYQVGEIRAIAVVQRQQCAFIQCATRQAAAVAAEKSFNKLIVSGRRLNVKWGRSQAARGKGKEKEGTTDSGIQLEPVPGLPGALPPPPAAEEEASANYFSLPRSGPPAVVNIALPPPPGIAPPSPPGLGPQMFHPMGPPPPFLRAPGPIHYPSQVPQRMGAHAGEHSRP